MKTHFLTYKLIVLYILVILFSTKIIAQHFHVPPFGPSAPIWAIYVSTVTLDDVNLEAGDELAVFDGDSIAGVFYLSQVCNPDNMFDNVLNVFQSTPIPYTGYSPGNQVSFKCWDASELIEAKGIIVEFLNPYGDAWVQNVFPEGEPYSIVEVHCYSNYYKQQIDLSPGFNFISSHIFPDNPDMLIVLENVLNEHLVFVRNSLGLSLQRIGPNWVNNIGSWIVNEGYFVKMLSSNSFTLGGGLVIPDSPVSFEEGFHFISYFPEVQIDALVAFETILTDSLEYIRNSQGQLIQKIGSVWVNGIGECVPGESYFMKTNSDLTLTYPFVCGLKFTDTRDGQSYKTVQIGDQCWMAENLNIGDQINADVEMSNNGIIEKYCYNNALVLCNYFGGLYQWNELMQYTTTQGTQGICPDGWHIPTDDEFKILEGFTDSQFPIGNPVWNNTGWRGSNVGINLKSMTDWLYSFSYNIYKFGVLPSGQYNYINSFDELYHNGFFWSSTETYADSAYFRNMSRNEDNIFRDNSNKFNGFSMRCLKN